MKAIQIKYCAPTVTKGARWKVTTYSHGAKYYDRDYSLDAHKDAANLAEYHLYEFLKWDDLKIAAIGTLPNGDYAAVLG